jgi:HSP20 family protein
MAMKATRKTQGGRGNIPERATPGHEPREIARKSTAPETLERSMDRFWREMERGPWSWFRKMPMLAPWTGTGLAGLTDWPAMDVAEDDKAMTIRMDVPGLDAKDVDVEVSGNLLTIRGNREDEWTDSRGGVHRRERRIGSFTRTVTLPPYVQADKVEARFDKGMLTVVLPRTPGQGPRRVTITS